MIRVIRTSHAELAMLRRGSIRTLPVPARLPEPTARKGLPPIEADCEVVVVAAATDDRPRARLQVITVGTTDCGDHWMVTVRAGWAVESPLYLASQPGILKADYTTSADRAMRDEPEVLAENANELVARLARTEKRRPVDRRPWRT